MMIRRTPPAIPVERFRWVLVATNGLAALLLFITSVALWGGGGGSALPVAEISAVWRQVLLIAAYAAFGVCILSLLVAVTIEARRIQSLHDRLARTHRRSRSATR